MIKKTSKKTYNYRNGLSYIGDMKDRKFHGQGTLTWANGSKFVGEFKNDNYHGQGTLTLADGEQYVGGFKNGNYHGQGHYIGANGDEYIGRYMFDVRLHYTFMKTLNLNSAKRLLYIFMKSLDLTSVTNILKNTLIWGVLLPIFIIVAIPFAIIAFPILFAADSLGGHD